MFSVLVICLRRRITIPLTLSNLKLLRRITRTENILHRNFTRRQVAIQNRVASNIGISQSTFSVKVLNLFSRSRRKTKDRKSGSAGMPRPSSYAVFCLKKKNHVEAGGSPARQGRRRPAPDRLRQSALERGQVHDE